MADGTRTEVVRSEHHAAVKLESEHARSRHEGLSERRSAEISSTLAGGDSESMLQTRSLVTNAIRLTECGSWHRHGWTPWARTGG